MNLITAIKNKLCYPCNKNPCFIKLKQVLNSKVHYSGKTASRFFFWYSRVPNKRGVRKIGGGGGWKWFDITIIRGVGIIGGGVLGEIENSSFLGKHVSVIYLCA